MSSRKLSALRAFGIMGFSAGGYVAAQAALDHAAANRPAFVASIYGCCENAEEVKVPDDAPPIFFLHAYNDPVSASGPCPAPPPVRPAPLQRPGIRLRPLALPGLESRQQARRVAHLRCRRPWFRHAQTRPAHRHLDRALRRLAPVPETHEIALPGDARLTEQRRPMHVKARRRRALVRASHRKCYLVLSVARVPARRRARQGSKGRQW